MIKKIVIAILVVFTVALTVLLVHRWLMLENEQRAFIQLVAEVAVNRKNVENRYIGSDTSENAGEGERIGGEELEVLPEFQELVLENPDFAGWIKIDNTAINYPVMQTPEDLEYYLHRDFEGQVSYAGTPFVGTGDMQNMQEDIFLYGHNMKNGIMFADLLQYQKKEFWRIHQCVQLDNRFEHKKYTVFAAFFAEEKQWVDKDGLFYSTYEKRREEWIRKLVDSGLYETGIAPNTQSSLLFLVTCKQNGRFVVVATQKN